MRFSLLLVALVVAPVATPVPASAPSMRTLLDAIPAWVGDPAPQVLQWNPIEGSLDASLSWKTFAEFLGRTPLNGPLPPSSPRCSLGAETPSVPVYCGPDIGRGKAASSPSYPCFDGIAWVAYRATSGGAAFTALERGAPLPQRCDCSDPCQTYDWEFVEMSTALSRTVAQGFLTDGCYSSEWMLHPGGYCPNSAVEDDVVGGRSVPNTFVNWWRARGPGVVATYSFGQGTGVWLDVFLGLGPITCYDVPASVENLGECPEPRL